LNYNTISLIATHDTSLGKMEVEYPRAITNYAFESYIEGSELRFDYKLHKGIATTMNATFLMEQMGIIPKK